MAHFYVSTACYHGNLAKCGSADLHGQCRKECKWCSEPCRCRCHVVVQVPDLMSDKQARATS